MIFSSARAARPFTPLNYRLSGEALAELIDRLPEPLVVVRRRICRRGRGFGRDQRSNPTDFVAAAGRAEPVAEFADPDDVAVVLFTSGTTSRPKAVELSHNNLTSYVTGTVEFASAEPGDAALICVPPYHIAGVGAALSNLYAGRKMVYLRKFDPKQWIRLARSEAVTSATVVPTMLDRIVTELEANPIPLPALRTLAYGGSKVALPLVRKALELLPDVGFVNAYGLTETSSTIAVLTPEDHRIAHRPTTSRSASGWVRWDSRCRVSRCRSAPRTARCWAPRRSASSTFAAIRCRAGTPRSARCSTPRAGSRPRTSPTSTTTGTCSSAGARDDTIIRGGENIAPAEVEDVLVEHPHVRDVAVVGVEDAEWGQIMVAVVVPVAHITPDPEDLRAHVRQHLRGSRTPDRVVFRHELPTTPTGKVLRRQLADELKSPTA